MPRYRAGMEERRLGPSSGSARIGPSIATQTPPEPRGRGVPTRRRGLRLVADVRRGGGVARRRSRGSPRRNDDCDQDLDTERRRGARAVRRAAPLLRPRRDRAGAQPRRVGGAPAVARGGEGAGRIDRIGVTHWSASSFGERLERALRTGRFDVVQLPLNALERESEERLLPLAEELGIAVIVMEPFGGTGAPLLRRSPARDTLEPLRRFGIETWAQALLKWMLSDPRVDLVIPATSRPERSRERRSRRAAVARSRRARVRRASGPRLTRYRPARMRIGVAKEIKPQEYRVALTPAGARARPARSRGGRRDGRRRRERVPGRRLRARRRDDRVGRRRVVERRPSAQGEGADRARVSAAARRADALHVPPHRRRRAADARTRRLGDHRDRVRDGRDRPRRAAAARADERDRGRLAAQAGADISRSRRADAGSSSAASRASRRRACS